MKNILYIPLDERPCNFKFMPMLAAGTDYNILVPPIELLGSKKTPAKVEELWDWVFKNIAFSDGAIISIDMLVYGGIVPSRLHHLSVDKCRNNLDKIKKLKLLNKSLKIYAFNLIMRCPAYSSSDEEPDYYEQYGRDIFLSGYLSHKMQLGVNTDEEQTTYNESLNRLSPEVLQDYTDRRKINHEINKLTIDLLSDGIIDFLVIPQDDSSPYGYTAVDQANLRKYISQNNLNMKVYMYPGADEVGMTLFARMVNEDRQLRPSVYVRFSSIASPYIVPLYEDRMLFESIKYHIICAGGIVSESLSDSDTVLMVNSPAEKMLEAKDQDQKGANYDISRNLPEFVEYIDYIVNTRKITCAIADVAYANGGDLELISNLKQKNLLFKISSYAGWNTSSNTLGTAIAQAFIYNIYGNTQSNLNFLGLRLTEDAAYCSNVRKLVTERFLSEMQLNYFKTDGPKGIVSEIVKKELQIFCESNINDAGHRIVIHEVYMPWSRMFETGLDVEVKKV